MAGLHRIAVKIPRPVFFFQLFDSSFHGLKLTPAQPLKVKKLANMKMDNYREGKRPLNSRASPCADTVPSIASPGDTLYEGAQARGSRGLAVSPGFNANYLRGVG